MSKATEAQLSDLHGLTLEVIMEELNRQRQRAAIDPEFSVDTKLIAQAITVLKNNNITSEAPKVTVDKYLDSVSRQLDGVDDDFPLNGFN